MRLRRTKLEEELGKLDAEERGKRSRLIWQSFKGTDAFWLLVIVLRDIEAQALDRLRANPEKYAHESGIVLKTIERIRKSFEVHGIEPAPAGFWFDDESFFAEEPLEALP